MADAEEIAEEQLRLQYISEDDAASLTDIIWSGSYDINNRRHVSTNRSRTFGQYSDFFPHMKKNPLRHVREANGGISGLQAILEDFIERNGKVVWIDLGCGNQVAQRQAKRIFYGNNLPPESIVAIGYDVLPEDLFEYKFRSKNLPGDYYIHDWSSIFNPEKRIFADAASAVFPEQPDLVTCSNVLQWNNDPLAIFANAARQVKDGAFMMFTHLDYIKYCRLHQTEEKESLFTYTGFDGFDVIGPLPESHAFGACLLRRNSEEVNDFTYGCKIIGRNHRSAEAGKSSPSFYRLKNGN